MPKPCYNAAAVKERTVSFRKIEAAHRKGRASDTRALRSGSMSANVLQEINSIIPAGATMKIANLAGYLKNRGTR